MVILSLAVALLAGPPVGFSRDIAPILKARCAGCHGERANQGGWRASTYANLLKKGDSGVAPVVPGAPEKSALFQRLVHKSPDLRMPQGDDPLDARQIALVRAWILAGGRFDGADPNMPLARLSGPRTHPAAPAVYRAPIPVNALAIVPGAGLVAVGGYQEVTLWRATDGALAGRLGGLPQRIQALTATRDGKYLLVGGGTPGEYGEAALVERATGKRRVLDVAADLVLGVAFDRDEARVAVCGADGGVRVYDRASGKRLWSASVHADWATSVGFSPDGRFVASAGKDYTVKVYDASTGALFTTYSGHNRQIGEHRGQAPVWAIAFAPTGVAYSAGGGAWVQLWDPVKAQAESGDAGDMEDRFARVGHARYLTHQLGGDVFALRVDAGQLFAASGEGGVRQYDASTLAPVRTFPALTGGALALDTDVARGLLAVGGFSGEVRLYDTTTGALRRSFVAQPGRRP